MTRIQVVKTPFLHLSTITIVDNFKRPYFPKLKIDVYVNVNSEPQKVDVIYDRNLVNPNIGVAVIPLLVLQCFVFLYSTPIIF